MRLAPSLIIIRRAHSLMHWTFCPRPEQIVWTLCRRIAQRLGKPRVFEAAHDLHHPRDETDNHIEVTLDLAASSGACGDEPVAVSNWRRDRANGHSHVSGDRGIRSRVPETIRFRSFGPCSGSDRREGAGSDVQSRRAGEVCNNPQSALRRYHSKRRQNQDQLSPDTLPAHCRR